jgi:hypothetical protein
MKNKFLFLIILVAGYLFVNFSGGTVYGQTPQKKVIKQQTVKYTCTMHPEIVMDKPGNCPKCGMKLVEKKYSVKGKMHPANDTCTKKPDHKKMMYDSGNMKKGHMMKNEHRKKDTTSIKKHSKGM